MATKEELQARITAAATARSKIDAADELVDLERQAVLAELEVKLTATLGRRGEAFEIVDGGPEGPIAMKLGESVLYKTYRTKVRADSLTEDDVLAFVTPSVIVPEQAAQFHEIVGRRRHLLAKCQAAMLVLYGGWEDKSRGK